MITDEYVVHGAFDDTNMGRELLADLPAFFWLYVDPTNSGTILKRREEESRIAKETYTYYGYNEETDKKSAPDQSKSTQSKKPDE
jgi:hypothetical protein